LLSLNLRVSVTLRMPKRPFRAETWAAWKSLLSGVKGVAASAPKTAVDHHRAVPIPNATTAKRSATLPATAAPADGLVLAHTSVAPVTAAVMAATVSVPAQAATPEKTDTAEVIEVVGLPEATVPLLVLVMKVDITEAETMVIDAREEKRDREVELNREDRAQEVPNVEMVGLREDHLGIRGSKENVAPVRSKETAKIAPREAPQAAWKGVIAKFATKDAVHRPNNNSSTTESQTMAVMVINAKCNKMPKSMIANSRRKRDTTKTILNASKRPTRPTKNEELSS